MERNPSSRRAVVAAERAGGNSIVGALLIPRAPLPGGIAESPRLAKDDACSGSKVRAYAKRSYVECQTCSRQSEHAPTSTSGRKNCSPIGTLSSAADLPQRSWKNVAVADGSSVSPTSRRARSTASARQIPLCHSDSRPAPAQVEQWAGPVHLVRKGSRSQFHSASALGLAPQEGVDRRQVARSR